ncbi:MAG: DUF3866 domain-containing protein [Actinobacteria bacterium HGW-Actinobacteria-9]|jgi:hypothetical protein|nr:MAG: DUF3866 domain-containing protein [Actinobacteria bacterium HGW-Actinobacteria-9]
MVTAISRVDDGIQHLEVALDDRSTGRAVSFPGLAGTCEVADRVLLNTTAVDLGLGTGGLHFVVARGQLTSGVAHERQSGGHIMKLRYTPLQFDVMAVEEQGSAHHEVMERAVSLNGMPVACCGLHSQIPLVAAAVKDADPNLKVAYVMTDGAALAFALSDITRASRSAGLIDGVVTAGQAFGGDLEAVNTHSALLAARHVMRADVAVVGIGPGVVGTATPFGHGGIAQGEALNAAGVLSGVPVAVLRMSFADARSRHHGVSHHSLSALANIALAPAAVPVPSLPDEYVDAIDDALEHAGVWERHTRYAMKAGSVPAPSMRGVDVKTMGRGPDLDPAFFAAAFAAGELCARFAAGEEKVT